MPRVKWNLRICQMYLKELNLRPEIGLFAMVMWYFKTRIFYTCWLYVRGNWLKFFGESVNLFIHWTIYWLELPNCYTSKIFRLHKIWTKERVCCRSNVYKGHRHTCYVDLGEYLIRIWNSYIIMFGCVSSSNVECSCLMYRGIWHWS